MKREVLVLLMGVIFVGVVFQFVSKHFAGNLKSQDTEIRQTLLKFKDNKDFKDKAINDVDQIDSSIVYSSVIYDYLLKDKGEFALLQYEFTSKNDIPEKFNSSRVMVKKQGVEIPEGICRNLTDEQYEQLYASTVIHDKPLTNALGENFKKILTKEKVIEIFEKM